MNEALAQLSISRGSADVYQFFWGDFCDWYIEWVKPDLQNADRERAVVAWKNLFAVFDDALRLLHPFMPFLTEELWHQFPQTGGREIDCAGAVSGRAYGWQSGEVSRADEFSSDSGSYHRAAKYSRRDEARSEEEGGCGIFDQCCGYVRDTIASESRWNCATGEF